MLPLSLPPSWRRALPLLMLGLAACGTLAPAAQAQDRPAQDVPEVVRELLERGESERSAGKLDDAIATYEEARRLGPEVMQIYTALGALHHQRGDLEASLAAFRGGLALHPKDRNLLFNAAVVALALERLDEARGFTETALAGNKKDVDLRLLLAAILDRQGEREKALAALLEADKARPGDAQIQFRLGNLYYALDRGKEAVEAYRKALKKDPSLLRAQVNLGAVLFGLGRNQEALEAYRVALAPVEKALLAGESVDKTSAVAFANLGAIHSQMHQWPQALQAYFNALTLDPQRRDLLASRAYVYYEMNKLDEAAADYQDVLADDAKSPAALLGLGLIESRRGRCAPAIDFLERGFATFAADAQVQALEPLAECYAQLGRGDEAEKAFRRLIEGRGNDAGLQFALGRLLRRQGKSQEAEEWLVKAQALQPDHLETSLELLRLAETRGDKARQITLAEDLLRRHAAQSELWPLRVSLALLYLEEGRAAEALPHYEALEASKAVPPSERAELGRCQGLALASAGRYVEARKKLHAAGEGGASVAAALAFVEAMAGKSDAALAALGGAKDTAQRANLGLLLWSVGRGEEARPHLQAALEAGEQGARTQGARTQGASDEVKQAARIALADLALRRGESTAATDLLSPGNATCREAPATNKLCAHHRKLWQLARLQQAQTELTRALRAEAPAATLRQLGDELVAANAAKDNQRAQALLLRGTARLLAGDNEGAAADFRSALESEPGELEKSLRANLGVALAQSGKTDEAQRLFAAQRDAVSQLNLGILLDNSGKAPEALPYYLAYLQGEGSRRKEVEGWVARLREVAP